MIQNESVAAARRILVYLVDASEAAVASLTFSGAEVQISKAGGAWANFAGTMAEIGGTGLGVGAYYYQATAAEVDTLGKLGIKIVKTGVRSFVYSEDVVVSTATEATTIAASVMASVVETGYTLTNTLRLIAASTVGKMSGVIASLPVFRAIDDSKARITATTTTDGRTVVTLDVT